MKEYKKLALFLACIVLLKIAFAFLVNNYSYFSLRDFFASILNEKNIVSLTNESRKIAGLNELKINQKLELAAQEKAEDMLKNQYFSHTSPLEKTAWDFLDDAGYKYLFAGENLAMNFSSAEEVIEGWLASLKHKENILDDDYTQIGIGIAIGKFLDADTTIIVQMFGKPLESEKESKRVRVAKRSVKVAIRTADTPIVKGVSIKKYISELEQQKLAQWIPFAKMHQLYAFPDATISTKTVLDILFIYIVVCGIGIFAYRFLKRKTAQKKH